MHTTTCAELELNCAFVPHLQGQKVMVETGEGVKYQGIFHTMSNTNEENFEVILKIHQNFMWKPSLNSIGADESSRVMTSGTACFAL